MKPFSLFLSVCFVAILSGFLFVSFRPPVQPSVEPVAPEITFDLANYVPYSTVALTAAQERGHVLLFFAATTWCQTCSALEKEIVARSREIPADVTILKVDYDNDTALNRQYAVASQHTLVLLDQNSKELKRWVGGGFDTLLKQIAEI